MSFAVHAKGRAGQGRGPGGGGAKSSVILTRDLTELGRLATKQPLPQAPPEGG